MTLGMASNFIIFLIFKSFVNLILMVGITRLLLFDSKYVLLFHMKINLQIFFTFSHWYTPINNEFSLSFEINSLIRWVLLFLDIAFIFNSNNLLKHEYEKTGIVIHKGILIKIDRSFEKSVSPRGIDAASVMLFHPWVK